MDWDTGSYVIYFYLFIYLFIFFSLVFHSSFMQCYSLGPSYFVGRVLSIGL